MAIRAVIEEFLKQRLDAKLEKLANGDPKRAELQAQFVRTTWLDDAARRASQIQAVTHSLKPIHPDAKGSSLYCEPKTLAASTAVSSYQLGQDFDVDVVGNAAALDVYKLLKLNYEGSSFLDLSKAHDAGLAAALCDDPVQARTWMASFARLSEPRDEVSTHTHAKQIYWPVGDDLHDDASYHLLAPLYPTSLIHRVYKTLQDDRFSDSARDARAARKAGEHHERHVRDYSNLAIQKLGGTKPQNISQLNSERRGDNFLLASLPPFWETVAVRPLHGVDSLFKRFGRATEVQRLVREFRHYLTSDPARNLATRQRVRELVDALIDELMQFAAELRAHPPGWSAAPECELPPAQRAWLDVDATDEAGVGDTVERISFDFANWLNAQLRDPLPMGDPEFLHWRKLARDQFKQEEREATDER